MQKVWKKTLVLQKSTLILQNESRFVDFYPWWASHRGCSGKKDSVVDVRCTDQQKRQLIVEMQLYWNEFFQQSSHLNATKAVARQLGSWTRAWIT